MNNIHRFFRNVWDILSFAWLLLMLAPEEEDTPESDSEPNP